MGEWIKQWREINPDAYIFLYVASGRFGRVQYNRENNLIIDKKRPWFTLIQKKYLSLHHNHVQDDEAYKILTLT